MDKNLNNDMDKNLMTMDVALINPERLEKMSMKRLYMEMGKCVHELIAKHGFSDNEAETFVRNVIRIDREFTKRTECVGTSIMEDIQHCCGK